jgi:raffinose/stachyose/melibiose transport system substrate-binding protein
MKRTLALLLAALLVATCLPTIALASSEKPKVVFANQATNVTDLDEQLRLKFLQDPIAAAFPDYDISIEYYSDRQTLQVQIAGGGGPDIAAVDGPTDANEYAKAGRILALDAYAEKYGWADLFFPWAYETCKFDGKLYSLPNSFEGMVIYYNKDVFEANGWSYPTTAAELEEICKKCQAAGIVPLSFGNSNYQGAVDWLYSTFLSCYAGPDTIKAALKGEKKWDDPQIKGAIQMMVDYWQKGYLGDKMSQAISNDDMVAMFADGKAAMMIDGTWATQTLLNTYPNCNWDIDVMPELREGVGRVFPLATGGVFMINANTKNPDAAAEVLNYLFTSMDRHIASVEEGNWQPYPVKAFDTTLFTKDMNPKMLDMYKTLMDAQASGNVGYCSWTFFPSDARVYMNEQTDGLFLDMLTIDEYLGEVQKFVDNAIATGNSPFVP